MKDSATKPSQNGSQNTLYEKQNKAKRDAAKGLSDLFVDELKCIYWAEKELTKAIPKMIKNALSQHLKLTEKQVARLENVFSSIDEKAVTEKCEAMSGLIKEAEEIIEETEREMVRDTGIILTSQKVEHYCNLWHSLLIRQNIMENENGFIRRIAK